jgi:hypothetical protein
MLGDVNRSMKVLERKQKEKSGIKEDRKSMINKHKKDHKETKNGI